jgi:hypothetical protein
LKNLGAQAKAVSALRLAESSNKALYNYSAAARQAAFFAAFALKAYKAFIFKVNQNKRLLIAIILKT